MTTIIVVAIVALVFVVTISVIAFMVWRQETTARTGSLRAIEFSISDMAHELAEINANKDSFKFHDHMESHSECFNESKWNEPARSRGNGSRNEVKRKNRKDPFEWSKQNCAFDNALENDTVTIFKPVEGKTHKLKWTEVYEARKSDNEILAEIDESIVNELPVSEESPPTDDANDSGPELEGETVGKEHEINLSFIDAEEFDLWENIEFFDSLSQKQNDYNRGRSGRKYTAEELETLIKE